MVSLIPPELSDRIIDHLHDDTPTLSACSLTCRSWLPTARYHRFASITLYKGRFSSFFELLDSGAGIGAVVVSLSLRGNSRLFLWRIDHMSLSRLLFKLPALQHLRLECLQMPRQISSMSSLSIKALDICYCSIPPSNPVQPFLASLSHLDRFLFQGNTTPVYGGVNASDPPNLPTISHLCLGDNDPWIDIFSTILHGGTQLCVQSLSSHVRHRGSARTCAVALRNFGSTLTHVDIVIDSDSSVACMFIPSTLDLSTNYTSLVLLQGDDYELNLQHCDVLRSCHLRLYSREMCVSQNQSLPLIWDLASQINSTFLEEIIVSIRADAMEDLRALDAECGVRELSPVRFDDLQALEWGRIDAILTDGRFQSLRHLVFHGRGDPEGIQTFIQDQYPSLAEVLSFDKQESSSVF